MLEANPDSHQILSTFGRQLEQIVERQHDYSPQPRLVSQNWSDLKGVEDSVLVMSAVAIAERLSLLKEYGLSEEGINIIMSKRQDLAEADDEEFESLLESLLSTYPNT